MLSVAAAEARNAEGARTSTLRIPSPPFLTGNYGLNPINVTEGTIGNFPQLQCAVNHRTE